MSGVKVTIKEKSGQELYNAIEKYFQEYHPAGYGTHIADIWKDEDEKHDSVYCADIRRASTCD